MARDWDLTSASAIQAAAVWLQKKSGSLLVVIVRVDDLAVAADPQLAPRDSVNLIEDREMEIWERLKEQRAEELAMADRKRGREARKYERGQR